MQRTAPPPPPGYEEDLGPSSTNRKRELVQRVVSSEIFRRSPALCAFLLYITDQEILGRADKLKEQTIGVEVLGRKPDYIPAEDNIVRVRAHELRGRLERYFASEGVNESTVIKIPLGAYAPEFAPRKAAPAEIPAKSAKSQTGKIDSPVVSGIKVAGRYWFVLAAIVLAAVLASIVATRYLLKSEARAAGLRPAGAIHDFWAQFFDKPNEELKIVYADTNFALWQDLNNRTLDLGDYINRKYLNAKDDKFPEVGVRRVASPADVKVGVQLAVLTGEFGGQINLRFARDADTDFLHRGNVVLIGSHRSNPWIELYEPSLNFELGQDPHSGAPLFRNRSPHPGEAQMYAIPAMFDTQKVEEKAYVSYGVVALLQGCGNHGLTVLAEGLNMQATQAAGDLVSDAQLLDTLLRNIGHKAGTNVTPFEALIQITSLPGGYDNPEVIAYRIRSAESCVGN